MTMDPRERILSSLETTLAERKTLRRICDHVLWAEQLSMNASSYCVSAEIYFFGPMFPALVVLELQIFEQNYETFHHNFYHEIFIWATLEELSVKVVFGAFEDLQAQANASQYVLLYIDVMTPSASTSNPTPQH